MPSILDTDAIGRLQVALDARANEKSRRFIFEPAAPFERWFGVVLFGAVIVAAPH